MRSVIVVAATAVVVLAPPAHAQKRTEVVPYLEVQQVLTADLKGDGDTVTYTTVAAGIDASTRTARAEAQVSYRYEYRFGWGDQGDSQVHSGLARGNVAAIPGFLNLEGGALATRIRSDFRGGAPALGLGDPDNVTQLYSIYAGPTVTTRVGDFDVGAYYRFGYTKVESEGRSGLIGGPALDLFNDSTSHVAGASIGMKSGVLPFGWTVSTGYEREDASQLDQRYEAKFVRADAVLPVSPTVAVVGSVGYEDIQASQRDALRDAAGNPVLNGDGRFVTDPASPRLLSYDESGFIWDTGVLWRPSSRTSLEARVGRRYGSMTYTGSFNWQASEAIAVSTSVYDGIQTFGRQITGGLSRIPTRFTVARDPFGGGLGGGGTGACVFGVAGANGTGGGAGSCLSPALLSVASGVYRTRGANALVSYNRGPWAAGYGVGYAQRRFFAPEVGGFSVDGVRDEAWYAQAYVARRLDEVSGVEGNVYANWFDSGVPGAGTVFSTGATATYNRTFGERLRANASLGLYAFDQDEFESSLVGAAQIGARYSF